jgi:hypothetical protein
MTTTVKLPGARKRGSSGAVVSLFRNCVVKSGNERVGAQGAWLGRHESPATPRVFNVKPTSYEMERLSELPRHVIHPTKLAYEMTEKLSEHVWSQEARVFFNPNMHLHKMENLIGAMAFTEKFRGVFESIKWGDLEYGLTHGDPTYDNVMLRHGEVVLIDPLPATTAVPDLIAVDRGKMLQSVMGFEMVRYGDRSFDGAQLPYIIDENEYRAALYWCAVHFLRAIPYVEEGIRSDLFNRAVLAVRGL